MSGRFKLLPRLNECVKYYEEFQKIPDYDHIIKNADELDGYEDFYIGRFVYYAQHDDVSKYRTILESIFRCKLEPVESNEEVIRRKVEACREYHEVFPNVYPTNETMWRELNIHKFIKSVRSKSVIEELDNMFHKKLIRNTNRMTPLEKLNLLKKFHSEFGREPRISDVEYEGHNVRSALTWLMSYGGSEIKKELETMFELKINISDKQKIELCRKFYAIHHRQPMQSETIEGFSIGIFVHTFRYQGSVRIEKEIEEIFGDSLINKLKPREEYMILLCREFRERYNRYPKTREIYKKVWLGQFIRKASSRSEKFKSIFDEIFKGVPKIEEQRQLLTDETIELLKEYHQQHNRLPKPGEKYKSVWLGRVVHNARTGKGSAEIRKFLSENFGIKTKTAKFSLENQSLK